MEQAVRWIICSLSALYLCIGISAAFDGCRIRYGRRGCYDKVHTGVLVSCDGDGSYHEIPKSIPSDTVYLSLVNFDFGRLQRANFTRLKTVECMIIMDSGVSTIEHDTFSDMENLHELELENTHLTSNHLQFINNPEFRAKLITLSGSRTVGGLEFNGTGHLNKMKVFRLGGNNINYIHPSILQQLVSLEALDLSENQLDTMDWLSLTGLTKLNNLYLDGNKFQMIPESVADTFAAVKELRLANNPFHCNCKLKWLKDYYETAVDRLLDYDIVACASPFNRRMIDTFPEEFVCSHPAKPSITWRKLSDTQYLVDCSSFGDPAPTLTVTLPNTKKVIHPPSADLSKLNASTPAFLASPGPVTCEAENSQGTITTTEHIPEPEGSSAHRSRYSGILLCFVLWLTLLHMC